MKNYRDRTGPFVVYNTTFRTEELISINYIYKERLVANTFIVDRNSYFYITIPNPQK